MERKEIADRIAIVGAGEGSPNSCPNGMIGVVPHRLISSLSLTARSPAGWGGMVGRPLHPICSKGHDRMNRILPIMLPIHHRMSIPPRSIRFPSEESPVAFQ